MSSAGTPTSSSPTASACHSDAACDAPIIANAAAANPSGIEPPSPRKIRAGCASRLCGRKPTHAPASAVPPIASHASSLTSPSTAIPIAQTSPIVLDCPSMLSNRLNALTTTTTQTAVAARSTAPPSPSDQPRSTAHSSAASPTSTSTRSHHSTVRRSSIVPTTHSVSTPPAIGSVRSQSDASSSSATRNPSTSALPPRYGVGRACPL